MSLFAGGVARGSDLVLPDPVDITGPSTFSVTSTSWADVTGCSGSITNPHASADMLCLVSFGAWMNVSSTPMRICPRISGSMIVSAGPGTNAPADWGLIPYGRGDYEQDSSTYWAALVPGTATFTMQAYRDNTSAAASCNYSAISVVPVRFLF